MITLSAALLWLQVGLICGFASLAFTGFMARAGLGDAPDSRSAHTGVVPTGGGIGIIAGLGLGLCAVSLIFPNLAVQPTLTPVLSLIFAVAALGLCDDALTLGPGVKFSILIGLSALAGWVIGPPLNLPGFDRPIALPLWAGLAGAALWVFVVTNIVNFMDGANGMIGLSALVANIALFGLALGTGSAPTLLLSGLMVAALLGFLPYNFRRKARVFSGDVGSLTVGFTFAVAVLFLLRESETTAVAYAAPVLILPFLTDTLLTLLRRLKRRENVLRAHNLHLYQRLIRAGWSHLSVSWLYGIAALICANGALVGAQLGWFDTPVVLLLSVVVFGGLYLAASLNLPD